MANLYIGPFEETACNRAAVELLQQAQCKQSDYNYACAIDGKPGSYMTCPHFTYSNEVNNK